jgi:hypothetical protein
MRRGTEEVMMMGKVDLVEPKENWVERNVVAHFLLISETIHVDIYIT